MGSQELDNLVRIGRLKVEAASRREYDGMVKSARRGLTDAQNKSIDSDSQFDLPIDRRIVPVVPSRKVRKEGQQNKENTVEHERKRAELLRQIARNKAAEFGDRGDAILELGDMSPEFSEAALLEIARDRDEDEDLVEDAGDALGSMWVKLGQIPIAKIRGITPPALKLIIGHLKAALV